MKTITMSLSRAYAGLGAALVAGLLIGCGAQENGEEKPMTVEVSEASATQEGVPGGITTRTAMLTATVTAIDYEARTVTLEDADGGRKTLTMGPEAVNFDQIEQGDQVKVAYMEEIIIYVNAAGSPVDDAVAAVGARAAEGEKPQGLVAGVVEVTAVVTAIDAENHTATLQFEDGSEETVPVRPDVKLSQDQIGSEVVIHMTTAIAVSVDKVEAAE